MPIIAIIRENGQKISRLKELPLPKELRLPAGCWLRWQDKIPVNPTQVPPFIRMTYNSAKAVAVLVSSSGFYEVRVESPNIEDLSNLVNQIKIMFTA